MLYVYVCMHAVLVYANGGVGHQTSCITYRYLRDNLFMFYKYLYARIGKDCTGLIVDYLHGTRASHKKKHDDVLKRMCLDRQLQEGLFQSGSSSSSPVAMEMIFRPKCDITRMRMIVTQSSWIPVVPSLQMWNELSQADFEFGVAILIRQIGQALVASTSRPLCVCLYTARRMLKTEGIVLLLQYLANRPRSTFAVRLISICRRETMGIIKRLSRRLGYELSVNLDKVTCRNGLRIYLDDPFGKNAAPVALTIVDEPDSVAVNLNAISQSSILTVGTPGDKAGLDYADLTVNTCYVY